MAPKNYKVLFYQTSIGPNADFLRVAIPQLLGTNNSGPQHLSTRTIDTREYQVRDFARVPNSQVWTGVFGRRRDDAPHKVDSADQESSLNLQPTDRLLEKCHFIYKADKDVLVWQVNSDVGYVSRFSTYLGLLLNLPCSIDPITGTDGLQRALTGQIKMLECKVARPQIQSTNSPVWGQKTVDLLKHVNGANIKIKVSAGRGSLGGYVKNVIQHLNGDPYTKTLKIRIEGDEEPIDLLLDRVVSRIEVTLNGHYPDTQAVLAALDKAFDGKKAELKPYFR